MTLGRGDHISPPTIALRRALRVCLCVWLVVSLWLGSNSGISTLGLLMIIGGSVVMLISWLIAVVTGIARKQPIAHAWAEPLVIAVALVAIFSGALFYLRLVASRPFLDRYVARVIASGTSPSKCTHVGLFVAHETEILPNGVVRIITTPCMFEECGVAFSRTKPPIIGEDRYKHITGNWWRWWRSW